PPGSSPADVNALAQPVDNLYFAGEATSRDYAATVHGAILSGYAAAEMIVASAFCPSADTHAAN
ncbi:MAG: FAD-dependent oxidoreductase, partial [Chitinophagaceae bacterium]|nr:FAD-dependent oxidoreductase [Anaerolineae bacterium]